MNIILYFNHKPEIFQADVANLSQALDYLNNFVPDKYELLLTKKVVYGLIDSTEKLESVNLTPELVRTTFEGYDTLLIGEKFEGKAFFSAVAAAISAAIAPALSALSVSLGLGVAGLASMGVVSAVGFLGAGLLFAGIAYGLGQLLQLMTPTQSLTGDPSSQQKSLVFNGIPNIDEQGGGIPLIFGECLVGGTKVGQVITTYDVEVGENPEPDKSIPTTTEANIPNVTQSKWYRVV